MTGAWEDRNCFSMLMKANRNKAPRVADFSSSIFCVLLLLLCFAAGCATPIGVTRGSIQDTYYALTANVLSTGEFSNWSNQVLQRTNLTEKFDKNPEAALLEMRKVFETRMTPDRLFALAELSFYYAEKSGKNEHFLASAVYAYAFLFPEDGTPPPDPLDPRLRLAADIYNLGIVLGLDTPDGEAVVFQDGKLALPFGEIELSVDQASFIWGGFRFKRFVPVGEFQIRGLSNRYRQAGIGAPFAAELEPLAYGTSSGGSTQTVTSGEESAGNGGYQIRRAAARGRYRKTQRHCGDLCSRPHVHGQA